MTGQASNLCLSCFCYEFIYAFSRQLAKKKIKTFDFTTRKRLILSLNTLSFTKIWVYNKVSVYLLNNKLRFKKEGERKK